ncbi:MAG: CpsD/CapB family tyrosine-protein kinase [Acidobacteriales bacterium]|nr:CpsD/CapB family tyrosine-protein kinase [Terriglobales bacterium]
MNSILGLHTSNTIRLMNTASPRSLPVKRIATPLPIKKSRLVFVTEPAGLAVEQYKILHRRLCNQHPEGGVVLVTSPSPGEGKTLTSINLAWCMAEAGRHTCLVDMDFRAPGVTLTLGCSNEEDGLEEVLTGRRTVHQSMRQVGDRSLYVLGINKALASLGGLLSSDSIVPLITELRAMFHWVILDFAPVIPMADVGEVLPHVDGAIIVVRSGKTDKSLIAPSLEILGSKIWGVILNDSVINGSAYYGYYGMKKG